MADAQTGRPYSKSIDTKLKFRNSFHPVVVEMITVGTPGLGVRRPDGNRPMGNSPARTHAAGGRPDRASLQWMKIVDESVNPKLKYEIQ
jgi:hypothetical protein